LAKIYIKLTFTFKASNHERTNKIRKIRTSTQTNISERELNKFLLSKKPSPWGTGR
jgi:hypothetical protein